MVRHIPKLLRVERLESRDAPTVVPVGGEFRANTYTAFGQGSSDVAVDVDGDFVVVWASGIQDGSNVGVYAQRYSAAGVPQGGEFRVNSYTTNTQWYPGVAMNAGGDFVVVWYSTFQDGGGNYGVYAQRYSAAGVPQGGEFRVNTYTTGDQVGRAVAMNATGDFVVAWSSSGQDGSSSGVYAQRYSAAGVPQGGEFRVNTYTTGPQSAPAVAMNAGGDFVVVWHSTFQDGGGNYGVYAQRYNAAGVPQGGEFRVNTFTTANQNLPAVNMTAAGDFVVAWTSGGQDGSGDGVYAQSYSAGGVPQGGEFRVNTYTTGSQAQAAVAMSADGDFVVAWTSYGQDGSTGGIYAQAYRADGVPDGAEFRVNTYTTGLQRDPAVAISAAGDCVITWGSDGQDGSSLGVYAQRYRLENPPRVAGTAVNGGAVQRSRITNLAVTFNAPVTFATTPGSAFTLTHDSDGAAVTFTAMADMVAGVTVVTLTNFSGTPTDFGSVADGRYTLTALASQISANGQQMASNYTFGDAQGLFRFYGDMNGDRRVDISDFGFFSLAYLQTANYNSALDFNNDGRIDIADFGQFSARFFTTLP